MTAAETAGGEGTAPVGRLRRLLLLLLFSAYVLPVVFPPAGEAAAPLPPDASLAARLFPGIPAWWVGGRLLALLAAVGLLSATREVKLSDSTAPPIPPAPEF